VKITCTQLQIFKWRIQASYLQTPDWSIFGTTAGGNR